MQAVLNHKVRVSVAAVCGALLATFILTTRVQADSWDKMTLLTVSEPTQVSDTYLEPGTYMFKLAGTDRHIVQIFNRDRSRLINTIFAVPAYRVNVTDKTQFTYWETPPGTARAVRTWYWPGDHDGQEFTYPTSLRQVAFVTAPPPVSPPPPQIAFAGEPQPPQTEPAPQAELLPQQQAPPPQEPIEIAQNNPPPSPLPAPEPPAAESPSSADSSQNLPQTASPFPAIGLGGLLALGLYFGIRQKVS